MDTLTLFNHKGGVGKTTLTVELAHAFTERGLTVLIVDTDPQCNISSFYLREDHLDELLGDAADDEDADGTVWAGLRPVVEGTGPIKPINVVSVNDADTLWLAVGDVLLSQYEEELPLAWTESFARKTRGYDVMCAISRMARRLGEDVGADIVMYDVGPNVGALNRTVLLDSDYFITPVHTDLYSLRALTTVGKSLSRWIRDWDTVRKLASASDQKRLIHGRPRFLGYISSAFRIYGGVKAKPHEYWEKMLPHRVKLRVVSELQAIEKDLSIESPYKIGDIKNFHSLAAIAQEWGRPMSDLNGIVDGGTRKEQVADAKAHFGVLATEILRRMGWDV